MASTALPTPDPALTYDWPTVLAQTMHRIANEGVHVFPNRIFYEYTTPTQASLRTLGPTQIGFRQADGVPQAVIDDSIAYANQLADAIVVWANEDGYYDVRYKGFIPPKGPDKWVPTGFSDTDKVANPLEPYFGTLAPARDDFAGRMRAAAAGSRSTPRPDHRCITRRSPSTTPS